MRRQAAGGSRLTSPLAEFFSATALLAAFESSQPGSEAQRGKSKSALGGPRITGESRHREEGAKK